MYVRPTIEDLEEFLPELQPGEKWYIECKDYTIFDKIFKLVNSIQSKYCTVGYMMEIGSYNISIIGGRSL